MLQREIVGDTRRQRRRRRYSAHGLRARRPSGLVTLPFSGTVRLAALRMIASSSPRLTVAFRACRRFGGRSSRGHNLGRLVAARFIIPCSFVVALGRRIEAGEQAVFRQLESVIDDERGVGVVDQVLVRNAVVLDGVIDKAAEKREVAAGANLAENIGLRRRAREARIHHDHLGVAVALGLHRPLESARMVLGWITAHDQHHVGILHVDPAIGHGPAPESWSQT